MTRWHPGALDGDRFAVAAGDRLDRHRPAVDTAGREGRVRRRHVERRHVHRAEREGRVVVSRQVAVGRQVRVPAEQRRAVRSGQPHAGRRPDHAAEPYALFKSRIERVDRRGGPVVNGVGLSALRPLGVDDLEWRDVAAVAVVVGPDRRRRGDPQVVAERLALLERGHQREHLRRGAGLHARARAVPAVDRVVDGCVARPGAERPVDRDGPDVARARLDQHFGVGVVARVVIVRIRRLDEVDGMIGGALIARAQRRRRSSCRRSRSERSTPWRRTDRFAAPRARSRRRTPPCGQRR